MRNLTRKYGMIALVLLMPMVSAPLVFATDQAGEDFSHLDGLAYNDCSVVCDELHYSDACHAYRAETPCPAIDNVMVSTTDQ